MTEKSNNPISLERNQLYKPNYELRTRTIGSVLDSASPGALVDDSPSNTSTNFEITALLYHGAKVIVRLALKSLE